MEKIDLKQTGLYKAAQIARQALDEAPPAARDAYKGGVTITDLRDSLKGDQSVGARALDNWLARTQAEAPQSSRSVQAAQMKSILTVVSHLGGGLSGLALHEAMVALNTNVRQPAGLRVGIEGLMELSHAAGMQAAMGMAGTFLPSDVNRPATTDALGARLKALSDYKSQYPSYEAYNVAPADYASPQQVLDQITQPGQATDVRANSYSLGTYLGTQAQKEGIVAQQVLDVLSALRHGSDKPDEFDAQLKKGLRMAEPRRQELAELAPTLGGFRELKSFSEIAKNPSLRQAVATFVESTHNWGPQPEDFHGTSAIVDKLLKNPDFMKMADKEALAEPMKGKPPVGIVLRNLGYKEPISNGLQEASMGVQAVDRLLFLPKNAADLVPLDDVASSPPPFPKQLADKIEPYAKDVQLGVKMNLAVAQGMLSGKIELPEMQQRAFDSNRLRLAYLSAGELTGILQKEASSASAGRQAQIGKTIEQLEHKRAAVVGILGAGAVADLDVSGKTPEQIRGMMRPLLDQSRNFFNLAMSQLPQSDKKDKGLAYIAEFAPLTSLNDGSPAPAADNVLGVRLSGLPQYTSKFPSYEDYNTAPQRFDTAQQVTDLMQHPGQSLDMRANSYSLGTYLGTQAQKEGIVAQQVLDVLNALRHNSGEGADFAKGLNMSPDRRAQLAQLSAALEPFRAASSFADVAKDPTLRKAVATFVESSHNWGPQPEDFHGTGAIVDHIMSNPDFLAMADKEALAAPMKGRPPVGIVMRNLGYKEPISNDLQEASMGVQAVDRLLFLPKNAADLVPIGDLSSSPAPFPKHLADKIEPYAKDIQLGVKLHLAVANGLNSGTVQLDKAQMQAFEQTRLKLAYLAAGELSGILEKEAGKAGSVDRLGAIHDTIAQLQLKRSAIEWRLGPAAVKDLDITGKSPDQIRGMMRPLLAESRHVFDLAMAQLPAGEKKDKGLAYVNEFSDLTSLKQPAA
jgi:hypothetical protein